MKSAVSIQSNIIANAGFKQLCFWPGLLAQPNIKGSVVLLGQARRKCSVRYSARFGGSTEPGLLGQARRKCSVCYSARLDGSAEPVRVARNPSSSARLGGSAEPVRVARNPSSSARLSGSAEPVRVARNPSYSARLGGSAPCAPRPGSAEVQSLSE